MDFLQNEYVKRIENYGLWIYGKTLSYAQPILNSLIQNDFEINEICTGVYIGDFSSACNVGELQKLGITHIVSAILGVGVMYPDNFKYHIINISDRSHTLIKEYFDECSDFIENCVNGGGSRSVTLIAAYLIKKKNYTAEGSIDKIKKLRICANPNSGFYLQLEEYEKEINNK
jgi:hypothetical protein